jgi:exonuclease III
MDVVDPKGADASAGVGAGASVCVRKKPKCKYAISCYRQSEEHKQEYRHPTDSDWTDDEDDENGKAGAKAVDGNDKGPAKRGCSSLADPNAAHTQYQPPTKEAKISHPKTPARPADEERQNTKIAVKPLNIRTEHVIVVAINAASVVPETKNRQKLPSLLDEMGKMGVIPDLIFVSETKLEASGATKEKEERRKLKAVRGLLPKYTFFSAKRQSNGAPYDKDDHKGVGLFVRKDSAVADGEFSQPAWDEWGHVCVWTYRDEDFVGVYLPTPTVKHAAMREVYDERLLEYATSQDRVVAAIVGDMNTTRCNLDCQNGSQWGAKPYVDCRQRMENLLDQSGLVDAWREKNPHARRFTSYQNRKVPTHGASHRTKIVVARVDFALVREGALQGMDKDDVRIFDDKGVFVDNEGTRCLIGGFDHVPIMVRYPVDVVAKAKARSE